MNIFISFAAFILFVKVVDLVSADKTDAYWWEEFKGVIPADAFAAGFDQEGSTVYIGQVLYDDKLIAGAIYKNDNNIYFEIGEKALKRNKNIKILCVQQPENMKWISTTSRILPTLNAKLLIKGGYEGASLMFIGRAHYDDNTYVGKVICHNRRTCLGLYANRKNHRYETRSFEVLSYSPDDDDSVQDY